MKRRRYIVTRQKFKQQYLEVGIMIEMSGGHLMNSKFKVISFKNDSCFHSIVFLDLFILRTIFVIILSSF